MANTLSIIKSLEKGDRIKITTYSTLKSGMPKIYFGNFQDYQQRPGDFIFTVNIDQGETDLLGASKQTTLNFRNSTVKNIEIL
jgi:ribosomal protein L21E